MIVMIKPGTEEVVFGIQLFYIYGRLSLIKLQLRHFAKYHDLASKNRHRFPVLL